MANYPQELAQDAVCQSHTGHMTGLWFLPTRPLRLNTNEWMNCIGLMAFWTLLWPQGTNRVKIYTFERDWCASGKGHRATRNQLYDGYILCVVAQQSYSDLRRHIVEVSTSDSVIPHPVGLLWSRDRSIAVTSTWQHNINKRHPCPQGDSSPQSQQASGRRPTH